LISWPSPFHFSLADSYAIDYAAEPPLMPIGQPLAYAIID
jgi:hypothetical protein